MGNTRLRWAPQLRNCPLTCEFICALGRIRTCGTRFRKPMLYPLSYEGV